MRISSGKYGVKLWLSARDTYRWATRPGRAWPCSTLSGKRLFAEFDAVGDLVDLTVNGRVASVHIDGVELDAIAADFILAHLDGEGLAPVLGGRWEVIHA